MEPAFIFKMNLPKFTPRFSTDGNTVKIFDNLRRKYVKFTPEENVRQHFVNWLINDLHYPAGLMNNEISIKLNNTTRRCDTIVFDKIGNPFVIIEYKAPSVEINQNVFDQIVRYNMVLKAKYLIVSNGIQHYCCVIDYNNNSYQFVPQIPHYNELKFDFSEN